MRRFFPALAIALTLALTPALRADDWPQWLGPKRDGVWRESGVVETFPKDGPKELWRVPAGVGYAGPAVTQGKVFVIDLVPTDPSQVPTDGFAKNARVPGSERILCLDQKTGKTVWEHRYPTEYRISYAAGPRCTPTVDGDRVYTLGAMGEFRCYTTAGKLVWSKNFPKDYESPVPTWGFAAHPLVDGDHVYGVCSYGQLRGIKAATGERVWESMKATRGALTPPKVAAMESADESERWSLAFLVRHDDRYFLFNEQGDLIIAKLSPAGYEE
ncbi:MAG TPA: PQQ-binding-like beta-propeller repeat protein, partial [Gemmata sp.]|nr:PQQ-binding-like beta-propeller repeat protein [Gemmata sp.]